MKAKTFLAIVFLCGSFGLAQAQSKMMFQGSGGVSIPNRPEEFSDYWKMGFNIGGGFGYFLNSRQRLALQGTIDYNKLPLDDRSVEREIKDEIRNAGFSVDDLNISVSGPSSRILAIFLGLRVNPAGSDRKIIPYLIGGLNLIQLSQDGEFSASVDGEIDTFFGTGSYNEEITGSVTTADESRFGLRFGAGLDLNLNYRSGIFVEAGYNLISKGESEDSSVEAKTLGLIQLKIGYFISI